jgi:hypothetical protein
MGHAEFLLAFQTHFHLTLLMLKLCQLARIKIPLKHTFLCNVFTIFSSLASTASNISSFSRISARIRLSSFREMYSSSCSAEFCIRTATSVFLSVELYPERGGYTVWRLVWALPHRPKRLLDPYSYHIIVNLAGYDLVVWIIPWAWICANNSMVCGSEQVAAEDKSELEDEGSRGLPRRFSRRVWKSRAKRDKKRVWSKKE